MYLDPDWRILTVGDGDLSFSASLARHHRPRRLVASVYDGLDELTAKYQTHGLEDCQSAGIEVLERFDVTCPSSWQRLENRAFDVVIFQFPLLPAFTDEQQFKSRTRGYSLNTLNRALLNRYLHFADSFALDKQGARLCYITSKDVKPYREWNLEGSLAQDTALCYLGQMPFEITRFPGYRIRNVDRDKHVKDTSGTTYVWGKKQDESLEGRLRKPVYLNAGHCALCRAGPFLTQHDVLAHGESKKHRLMADFETQWQRWLSEHQR